MHLKAGEWDLTYGGRTVPIAFASLPEWREVTHIDRNWRPFGSLRAMLLSTVSNVVAQGVMRWMAA